MITVIENVLTDEQLDDYLKRLQFARFSDIESQGMIYGDVSQDVSGQGIYDRIEVEMGFKPQNIINFLRAYRKRHYKHPMWIHSDVLFADYICIFFAQPSSTPQDDGVAFWRNKELDDIQIITKDHTEERNKIVDEQSLDPDKWEMWKRVEFKSNRMVIAPASYFHSKASYRNDGTTTEDCRIVHVLFFNKGETDV